MKLFLPTRPVTDRNLAARRRFFGQALAGTAAAGIGAAGLVGCGGGGTDSSASDAASGTTSGTTSGTSSGTTTGSDTSTSSSGSLTLDSSTETALATILATQAGTCSVAAQETEGPYPLRAVLSNSTMVRADITEGKTGVPLTLRLKVVDANSGCVAVQGAWVYIWHCDKDGNYSGYGSQAGLTFLRGIQQTGADGTVTFRTIYPGWYAGRITHIHCMVFLAGSTLASTSASLATTQFAFPTAITSAVYASSLYTKGQNTSITSFAQDNVFADGTSTEMLTLSGSASAGFLGGIIIGVNA